MMLFVCKIEMKLLAFVGVTLALSAPMVYASYLVYVKQQRLLCALKRRAQPRAQPRVQPRALKRVPSLAQVPVQVQSPSKDEEEHHDVGLDLDSIPMFTPMTALF